jgi:hypothetical protein
MNAGWRARECRFAAAGAVSSALGRSVLTGVTLVVLSLLAASAIVEGAVGLAGPPGALPLVQDQPSRDTTDEKSLEELRSELQRHYRVLPVRNGILLLPRRDDATFRGIEVTDGTVAVDGELVTGRELAERLGEQAPLVARLTFLGADEMRAISGEEAPARRRPEVTPPVRPEAPSPAMPPVDPPRRPADRTIQSKVRIIGDVRVAEDEIVRRDVVAIFGSVHVEGRVRGDAVAVGGSVYLSPEAVVDGVITVVGGRVHRSPGAVVAGGINEVSFGGLVRQDRWRPSRQVWVFDTPFGSRPGFVVSLLRMFLTGLFAAFVLLVARAPVARVEAQAAVEPLQCGVVGLLAQLLLFPALVLISIVLAITVIGIPLLILVPLVVILALIGMLLGFTAVAARVGRWATARFGWSARSGVAVLLIGLLLLWALTLFGSFAYLTRPPVSFFVGLSLALGLLVEYVALTIGFGAVLLTRFGTRWTPPRPAHEQSLPGDGQAGTGPEQPE